MTGQFSWRSVGVFVLLDAVTYVLAYWVLLPLISGWLAAWPEIVQVGFGHVLTAVRLVLVGVLVARGYRSRYGSERRTDPLPSVAAGAALSAVGGVVLALVGASVTGAAPPEAAAMGVGLVEWVAFGALGAMLVEAGQPERVSMRIRDEAGMRW
ncbi:hypothetical protein GCM10023216_14580 [Isoptericola chiayiensis]|uniref:Uncharacterized protein n=1 Tax=Isoptericola chiayiensis TaxID=579446 RepID=A0ABP8YED9_9MICO|nr:hypothetical protein [Isoptericola chiayiensis]NOW02089.1 hypothetical protein [Isoptericola chiayiensis]